MNLVKGNTYWVEVNGNDNNPGTKAQPFGTIQRAADAAQAGDTVMIGPGSYNESVIVKNSGTLEAPVVFQSVDRWGAIISRNDTSWLFKPAKGEDGLWSSYYVTIRGFCFHGTQVPADFRHQEAAAVNVARGWQVEDCLFDDCGAGVFYKSAEGDVDDVIITRCVFQNIKYLGLWSYSDEKTEERIYIKNAVLKDTILRRCNTENYDGGWHAGALKYIFTQNLTADGVISYDNNGSGFWLDWDNSDFIVRNCTFFGNHCGENTDPISENGALKDVSWAGVGIYSEANPDGLIVNNVIYSNLSAGIGLLESGFGDGVAIRGNRIVDCGVAIQIRAMDRGDHFLKNCTIQNNLFKSWREDAAWSTALPQTISTGKPEDAGIIVNGNTYDPANVKTLGRWIDTGVSSIKAMYRVFGAEQDGKVEQASFRGRLFPTFNTALQDAGTSMMIQVPSELAEKMTIDEALANISNSGEAIIPVFGRKKICSKENRWFTEVYDLQARYVRLEMDKMLKERLEKQVTDYAVIDPAYLKVRLTKKETYSVEGELCEVL